MPDHASTFHSTRLIVIDKPGFVLESIVAHSAIYASFKAPIDLLALQILTMIPVLPSHKNQLHTLDSKTGEQKGTFSFVLTAGCYILGTES